MVKLEDVAKKAGISVATVSRVLNNDSTLMVTDETRQKIQEAVMELGYKPLRKRKSKTKKSSYSFAMIHNDETFIDKVDRAYYFSIRNGIEQICNEKKISVFSIPINQLKTTELKYDGAIIFGNLNEEQHKYIRKNASTKDFVIIGLYNPYPDDYDHITFNTKYAVKKILDYLMSMGHDKIGCLGAVEFLGLEDEDSRRYIYEKIMLSLALYREDWVIFGSKGMQGGIEIVKELLTRDSLPTSIFVANDPTAIGVIQSLQDHNIQVPDDISIIGFNGDYTTEYTYPPLTTLKVNTREMGREGVTCLLDKLTTGRKLAKRIEISTSLIERKSVKRLK